MRYLTESLSQKERDSSGTPCMPICTCIVTG